ncbi:MAG: hypothetical protein HQM13_03715 [SAR324 cluster bacterium]|nr:hypothetical protein [SAR324 cluster bacterium]
MARDALVPIEKSIAPQLLGKVFGIYFLVAMMLTIFHMYLEYGNTKDTVSGLCYCIVRPAFAGVEEHQSLWKGGRFFSGIPCSRLFINKRSASGWIT